MASFSEPLSGLRWWRGINGWIVVSNAESLILAGYYGFGNAGDELILDALIQRCRRENPDTSIVVFSNSPSETRNHFGVRAVDRWRPWTWVRSLMDASCFI